MINTRVIKLNTKRGTIKIGGTKNDFVKDILKHFETLTKEEKEMRTKDIAIFEDAKRKLNISRATRQKNNDELTEEEKNKLYDEYVCDSIIHSCKSAIDNGACDIKYLFEKIEQELQVMQN